MEDDRRDRPPGDETPPVFAVEELLPAEAASGAALVGRHVLSFFEDTGRVSTLVAQTLASLPQLPRYARLTVDQMAAIGVGSLPLVVVVAIFTGAVTAVQAAYQLTDLVPLRYLGSVVQKSVVIELGPVLTALVVGGRVGASIAAELGTMRVTEQIDALESMAISPVGYLALPRLVASTVMLPTVTVFANLLAILGGFAVAALSFEMPWHTYLEALRHTFNSHDLFAGLMKSAVFGAAIGTMGCFYGFRAEGGAEGVGVATTRAVVASCVLILIADYVLANVLFRVSF